LIVKSCQKKVCPLGGTWKTFEHFSDHEVWIPYSSIAETNSIY
jgi:hypothetical protein